MQCLHPHNNESCERLGDAAEGGALKEYLPSLLLINRERLEALEKCLFSRRGGYAVYPVDTASEMLN